MVDNVTVFSGTGGGRETEVAAGKGVKVEVEGAELVGGGMEGVELVGGEEVEGVELGVEFFGCLGT